MLGRERGRKSSPGASDEPSVPRGGPGAPLRLFALHIFPCAGIQTQMIPNTLLSQSDHRAATVMTPVPATVSLPPPLQSTSGFIPPHLRRNAVGIPRLKTNKQKTVFWTFSLAMVGAPPWEAAVLTMPPLEVTLGGTLRFATVLTVNKEGAAQRFRMSAKAGAVVLFSPA